jgi:hypothetical protein
MKTLFVISSALILSLSAAQAVEQTHLWPLQIPQDFIRRNWKAAMACSLLPARL